MNQQKENLLSSLFSEIIKQLPGFLFGVASALLIYNFTKESEMDKLLRLSELEDGVARIERRCALKNTPACDSILAKYRGQTIYLIFEVGDSQLLKRAENISVKHKIKDVVLEPFDVNGSYCIYKFYNQSSEPIVLEIMVKKNSTKSKKIQYTVQKGVYFFSHLLFS